MLGKDLKPGDLIRERGLIITVSHEGDRFWDGPWFTYVCYEDPYHGIMAGHMELDEDYTILHERDTPEYDKRVREMAGELFQASLDRLDDARKVKQFHK